jgi:hypothetical protein
MIYWDDMDHSEIEEITSKILRGLRSNEEIFNRVNIIG